jgi:hypothetical protein
MHRRQHRSAIRRTATNLQNSWALATRRQKSNYPLVRKPYSLLVRTDYSRAAKAANTTTEANSIVN